MKHHLKPRVVAGIAALAVLTAASPAAAATSDAASQTATAEVASTLSATLPTAALPLALGPGDASSSAQPISVKSNNAWGLRIFADHANMEKWDGTAYVAGTDLANQLEVSLDAAAAAPVPQASTATDVGLANIKTVTAAAAQAAGDTGIGVDAAFTQKFSYADAPGSYRAVITYAVDQAF
jgi:hypothetical protein